MISIFDETVAHQKCTSTNTEHKNSRSQQIVQTLITILNPSDYPNEINTHN